MAATQAWTRDTIEPATWTVPLPTAALAELRAVLAELRSAPLPTFLLDPADFALAACRATMAEVRRVTQDGPMFAVLDRLPMAEISRDEGDPALLAAVESALPSGGAEAERPDVLRRARHRRQAEARLGHPADCDQRRPALPQRQFLQRIATRLCLPALPASGQERRCQPGDERCPELMDRLYQPFWYDRHAEHAPDEPTTFAAPIFERAADGTVKARLALSEIFAGYELRGERMDNQTAAALAAVQSVFDRPELQVELDFAPGQIQYVNNRATGHARTDFVDHPEPERKRHLVRLWLRDHGRRTYRG